MQAINKILINYYDKKLNETLYVLEADTIIIIKY